MSAARAARGRERPTGVAALLLLLVVAVGLLGQGGYYGPVQRLLGLLVAAAALLAMVARPPERDDARLLPVVPALALVAWTLADAVLLGVPPAGGLGLALLVAGVLAVLFVCRRLGPEDRELLVAGVAATGLVVALTGWLGVAWRVDALAWVGDGIWRASATLTYPNAAAAVLVPVALVVLARLEAAPRSLPLVLAATGLLAGLAATLSRAGVAAFAVGLVVLACLRGVGATARTLAGPGAGALVALAGLVPSMPATGPPRPAVALAGLAAGLALAALATRVSEWRAGRLLVGVAVVAALCGLALLGGAGGALRAVAGARASLASPDRTGALLAARQVVADHPLTGAGPGHTQLRWEGSDGVAHFFVYAHNEYAQVAAELGLVGLVLLALLLAGVARLLWRSLPAGAAAGPWAGVVAAVAAFAVHGGLDFIWHLPAVVLAVTVLAGACLPPPAPEIPIPVPPRKELHEATT
jgi:hypothetical protein